MTEEVICTACPKHCVIGRLAFSQPPKDSFPTILKTDGTDLIAFCRENYVEPSKD